jgi:hypothetical protein
MAWCLVKHRYNSALHLPGIAQWYSAGLRTGWSGVRVSAEAENFSLHHRTQTGSGAHPASYPMGTGGFFTGAKAAGSRSWPLTSTPSTRLHGAVLSKKNDRDKFTFTFLLDWQNIVSNKRSHLAHHKGKGKFVPVLLTEHHAMKAYWEQKYSSTHSLTSALDGGEWSVPRLGHFNPKGKNSWYPLARRLGGP